MAGSTTHRHAITFATSALAEHEGRAETLRTRYTTRDLFELFAVPFAEGGTWSLAGDNGDALDVAVIDERVARRWFGDASAIGRRVRIDGADVRVVGVVAAHYDDSYHLYERLVLGRDDIYLPLAHATAAKARPDFAHAIAGGESGYISAWVELPTPTDRVAFVANAEQYLARERASGRRTAVPRSVTLRSSAEWRMVYAPGGAINVWPLLTGLCLATSIINLVRMLMAKFAGRSHDLGLLRAFGARRRAVMGQLLLEAVLIGVAAAVIGLLLGLLMMPLAASTIERTVAGAPTTISITAIAVTLAASIGAALLAALYPAWHLSSGTPAKQLRGR